MIRIPLFVKKMLDDLMKQGFEAYIVGGCVRDSLLKRTPHDWDICTNAQPQEIISCFSLYSSILTGVKYGTVTVVAEGHLVEITTYRVDGKYTDSRRPETVSFARNLKEDLARRDFSINAMAYNEKDGLIDLYGGMDDLKSELIRCVGNAQCRFQEDALRMLRAIRFSAQLGYHIEKKTETAIKKNAFSLSDISAERIHDELTKILLSANPAQGFQLLNELCLPYVLPYFEKISDKSIQLLSILPAHLALRLSALLVFQPDFARKQLKKIRFDNRTIDTVDIILDNFEIDTHASLAYIRRFLSKVNGFENEILLFKKKYITVSGGNLEQFERFQVQYFQVLREDPCISIKSLAVNGNDLIALGIPTGNKIGYILRKLLDIVLETPASNTKEILLAEAVLLKREFTSDQ